MCSYWNNSSQEIWSCHMAMFATTWSNNLNPCGQYYGYCVVWFGLLGLSEVQESRRVSALTSKSPEDARSVLAYLKFLLVWHFCGVPWLSDKVGPLLEQCCGWWVQLKWIWQDWEDLAFPLLLRMAFSAVHSLTHNFHGLVCIPFENRMNL